MSQLVDKQPDALRLMNKKRQKRVLQLIRNIFENRLRVQTQPLPQLHLIEKIQTGRGIRHHDQGQDVPWNQLLKPGGIGGLQQTHQGQTQPEKTQ